MALMKSGSLCCMVGCVSNRANSPGTHFYSFPIRVHMRDQRLKWIAAVNRVNPDGSPWQPSPSSLICSKHFIGNQKSSHPQSPSYVPSIFPDQYKIPKRSADSMENAKQRSKVRPESSKQEMLGLSDSRDNSEKHKRRKLQKEKKDVKHKKPNSDIHISKAFNHNPEDHVLVPVTPEIENRQCYLELEFFPETSSIKQEPSSTLEFIRVPADQSETNTFLSPETLKIEEETFDGSEPFKQEEKEVDPLSIEEPKVVTLILVTQNTSSWIKKFKSLPLLYSAKGEPYTKCPACSALFFSDLPFHNHMSTHFSKQGSHLFCSYCNFLTENVDLLHNHLFVHQNQCEACCRNLSERETFNNHCADSELTSMVEMDQFGSSVCPLCDLHFDSPQMFRKHTFKHNCKATKIYHCNSCKALFNSDKDLEKHPCLRCPICDEDHESFTSLRIHTQYKKHFLRCSICSYEFTLTVDLKRHLDIHKKKYRTHDKYTHCLQAEDKSALMCEFCGKLFFTDIAIVLHINNDHQIDITEYVNDDVDKEEARPIALIINFNNANIKQKGFNFEKNCKEILPNS